MKIVFAFLILASAYASAATQAVVFDWGDVLADSDRNVVVEFVCSSLQMSKSEFEQANEDKRKAVKAGINDVDFWLKYAEDKGLILSLDWPQCYVTTLKESIGADPAMFAIIDELKKKQIRVGLLSNINDRYVQLIRSFGFYEPFDPCLLSCEIGLEKPNSEAYQTLLKELNLPPEEIIFIDDKLENVIAAKEMGIDAFVFSSALQTRAELMKRGVL